MGQTAQPEPQLRAIVAKRLSVLTEATTHLVSEAEAIGDYVKRKNIHVVKEAEDLDVSGGLPIRERPGVGPWLTVDRLDDWDVLIVYKLDRGFRNHLDFVTFYHEFCEVHGKRIVSVLEDIDMSTRMGKFFAGQLVQFAEWELLNMKQRRGQAADVIRRGGRWNGGSFHFGYVPYQMTEGESKVWYLKPHPVYAKESVRMHLMLASGKTVASICDDLNSRKILTARDVQLAWSGKLVKGYRWTTTTVINHLRSEASRGYVLHYIDGPNEPPVKVIGSDGEFVRREPVIDDELWVRVQEILDRTCKPRSGVRRGATLMLQVCFCGYCGGALHYNRSTNGSGIRQNNYYHCRNRQSTHRTPDKCQALGSVSQEALDDALTTALLDAVGSCEVTRKEVIHGQDHSATLRKLGTEIATLTEKHFVHGGVEDFHARMAVLQAEHERISALPADKPKVRRIGTGRTFRQVWEEMDGEQRHAYLISAGVTAMVIRRQDFRLGSAFGKGADTACDLALDIPMNIVREFDGRPPDQPYKSGPRPVRFVLSISLGPLRDQLQRAASA